MMCSSSWHELRAKGGLQFCTKDEGSADVDVKAVLSSDGRFGIGVEGEPAAKLHVEGDAIFRTGQCEDIHAQRINASVDVLVQERSVREDLEALRQADATVAVALRQVDQLLVIKLNCAADGSTAGSYTQLCSRWINCG